MRKESGKIIDELRPLLKEVGVRISADGMELLLSLKEHLRLVAEKCNPRLLPDCERFFAEPQEVNPDRIDPVLEFVETEKQKRIFTSALSFWSAPVSQGYGRRIKGIVFDRHNGKVMGVFGLCDPVIALSIRDGLIGWKKECRNERLYNCMTAHVLGAVPPYNQLLGGRLIALACISREIIEHFKEKYSGKTTVISRRKKLPYLVYVDTMGTFGRRITFLTRLRGWKYGGKTRGFTHTHITPEVFQLILKALNGRAPHNKYGCGANWKFRVLRKAEKELGLPNMLFLDVRKSYHYAPLAVNFREFLLGQTDSPNFSVYSFHESVEYWRERWFGRKFSGR